MMRDGFVLSCRVHAMPFGGDDVTVTLEMRAQWTSALLQRSWLSMCALRMEWAHSQLESCERAQLD
eukprot:1679311-Amphidinium_carterae.1